MPAGAHPHPHTYTHTSDTCWPRPPQRAPAHPGCWTAAEAHRIRLLPAAGPAGLQETGFPVHARCARPPTLGPVDRACERRHARGLTHLSFAGPWAGGLQEGQINHSTGSFRHWACEKVKHVTALVPVAKWGQGFRIPICAHMEQLA
eukprot:1158894-Pelagomonas_calceolata.AAC.4